MKQDLSRPPQPRSNFPALAAFLAVIVSFACPIAVQVGAQKNPQTTAGTEEPRSGQHKNLTPLKGSDSSDGSKVTVTSDGPLNDYSAFRSGDRYYVVIPGSEIPRAQSAMHGRGYEDVQVQKRGSDTVLSFRLKPGASARVNQKFNKLDIVINTPAGSSAEDGNSPGQSRSVAAASAQNAKSRAASPSSTSAGTSGKPNSNSGSKSGEANNTGQNDAGQNSFALAGSANAGGQKPSLSGESTPAEISPSPNSTALAVPSQQVAPLSSQGTASTPSSSLSNSGTPNSGTSTGESKGFSFDSLSRFWQSSAGMFVLKYWRWIMAAVLLLIALLLLHLRGRKAVHEQEVEAREEIVLSDQRPLPAAASQVSPVVVYSNSQAAELVAAVASMNSSKAEILESPRLVENESSVVVEKESPLVAEKALPIIVQKPEAPVVPRPLPTNFERAEEEVRHLLTGNEYDTFIVDSTDPGMRQFVATELLSAMGGRQAERRALAIAAFERHGYFDEATHTLRIADAQAERASSARALGLVRDTVATPHLVAALEDSSPDVRRAAVEALAEIRDPSAVEPLSHLLQRERDRKVPRTLIQRAIDASSNIVEEQPALPPPPSMEEVLPEIPGISDLVPQISASETLEEYEFAFATSAPVIREASELTHEDGTTHKTYFGAEVAAAGIIVAALDGGPHAPGRDRHSNNGAQKLQEHNHFKSLESNAVTKSESSQADLEQPSALSDVPDVLTIEGPEAGHYRSVAELSTAVPPVETFELVQPASNLHEAIKTETFVKAASPVFNGTVHSHEVPDSNGETAYSAISLDQVPLVSADDFLKQARDRNRNEWLDVDVNESDQLQHQGSVKETTTPSALEEEPELLAELPVGDSTPVREINADETSIEQFLSSRASSDEVLDVADLVSSRGRTASPASANEKEIIPLLDILEPENPIRARQSRLYSKVPEERAAAVIDLGRTEGESGFQDICRAFDDVAPEVRNAAAQTLYELNPDRAGSFTRALREAPIDRRRRIGSSLAGSGLAAEAIGHLTGEGREKTYDAFSLLFLMSKAGEVQPLVRAIEDHPSSEVRLTVVKLLALSGQHEILPYFRRLAVRGSLPSEVRSAVMEAIYQISNQSTTDAHIAARGLHFLQSTPNRFEK